MASKDTTTMVTWADALPSGALPPRAAPRLNPQSVIRAAVYIQGSYRRFRVEECRKIAGIGPVEPTPPVAVGLFMGQALRKARSLEEVQAEAATVAAVICGREEGLVLGSMVRTYSEYRSLLPPDNTALGMLRERFHEVAVDAEEDLYRRLRHCSLPSHVRQAVAAC